MKSIGFIAGTLALSACGLVACVGDDSNPPAPPSSDAGSDATVDATTEGGSDAGNDAVADAGDASDGGAPSYGLFVGSDFKKSELAVVALNPSPAPGTVAGRLPIVDGDAVTIASNHRGFVLERTLGKVVVLDPAKPWTSSTTIDINEDSDAASAVNPHSIVVTTGTEAYVARYGSNVVKIVDIASGAATGTVDLSSFMAADDPDGLVDVEDAVFDEASGRVYFLLQRIDQFDFSGSPPDFVSKCLTAHGAIVAVDVKDESIVDLNGASAGQALDLLGENPDQLIADFADGRIIVPETGCYVPADGGADAGSATRESRGIEGVTVATGTTAWLYQTTDVERIAGVIWVDAKHAFVNKGDDWLAWDPTQSTLGSALPNFPQAPFYDGAGRIIGLASTASEAGLDWSVVALDLGTQKVSTLANAPFQTVAPTSSFGIGSAFLK